MLHICFLLGNIIIKLEFLNYYINYKYHNNNFLHSLGALILL